jgi:hypothetical protein
MKTAVVDASVNQPSNQRPETIIGDVSTKLAELLERCEAPRDNGQDMRGRAKVRVDEDPEVAHCKHGNDDRSDRK